MSRPGNSNVGRRAFTLVELLVVVAILALLVSLLVPSLARARESARRALCASNLHALGMAWQMYFNQSNQRTPYLMKTGTSDVYSQFNYVIWSRDSRTFVNAGVLWESKLIGSERTYVCPTIERTLGHGWFGDPGYFSPVGGDPTQPANRWPVVPTGTTHSYMSYGTRRMRAYTDSTLANASNNAATATLDKDIMLCKKGVEGIPQAASFSHMADNFHMPQVAMLSHTPGINVLYLDSHVGFFEDTAGTILYDNGITVWGAASNWLHDQIWMKIDGTM